MKKFILIITSLFIVYIIKAQNTNYGFDAGNSGAYNTSIGYMAGDTVSGTGNTMLGHMAGSMINTGSSNTLIGYMAGKSISTTMGSHNTMVGAYSGNTNTYGNRNCFYGEYSGRNNLTGSNNCFFGISAGYNNSTGSNNVFLGYNAGYSETGSNKLYIDNSNTTTPLIYGDFSTDILTVNGNVGIGTTSPSTNLQIGPGTGNLHYGTNGVLIKFNTGDRALLELHSPDGQNRLVFQSLSAASYLASLDKKPLLLQFDGGNVGIGTPDPKGLFHIKSGSVDRLSSEIFDANMIIEATYSSRNPDKGAVLGFAVPANSDGSNVWQQGRIIVTPDNELNGNACGRMYLQTRYFDGDAIAWKWRNNLVLNSTGNVGIGTDAPVAKLQVKDGNVFISKMHHDYSPTITLAIGDYDTGLDWIGDGNLALKGNGVTLVDFSPTRVAFTSGNVLIGKTTQTNNTYKLDVDGKIRANEIVVNTTGADFVFAPTYKLRPLSEVESFIKLNQHLPEIAPAAEMQKEGVNVSELQTKLLQKLEEVTLYLIEQNKLVEAIKKENDQMKKELELLKNK